MEYEIIEEKIKNFVMEQVNRLKYAKTVDDVLNRRAIAYGAIMFSCNYLLPSYNSDLAWWWEKEAYNYFTEKIKEINNV